MRQNPVFSLSLRERAGVREAASAKPARPRTNPAPNAAGFGPSSPPHPNPLPEGEGAACHTRPPPALKLCRLLIPAAALLLAAATPARAVDVSNLAGIEDDPCFQQTHQRVLDSQLGAIESQIVAACTDAHGNPTDAMALLTERAKAPPWLPPASGGLNAASVLVAALIELAILSSLLGVDAGYAARALGLAVPALATPAILAVRLLAALLLTALMTLPGLMALGAAGLLAIAIRACRWRSPQPPAAPAETAGRLATGIGLLGTDLLANLPVTLGIAAASRGSLLLAAGGVLAAAAAARLLHPALARLLQRRPVLARAAGALIAAIAGHAALSDPGIAPLGAVPIPLLLAVPACLAGLALIVARRPFSACRPVLRTPNGG